MIIGATPSPDRTILQKTANLYHHYQLWRVYYSAFSPIPDAHCDLPNQTPPLIREHRPRTHQNKNDEVRNAHEVWHTLPESELISDMLNSRI